MYLFHVSLHEEVTTRLHLVTLSLKLIHPSHGSVYECVRTPCPSRVLPRKRWQTTTVYTKKTVYTKSFTDSYTLGDYRRCRWYSQSVVRYTVGHRSRRICFRMGKGLVSKKTHGPVFIRVGTGPNTTLMSDPDTLLSIGLTESTGTRGNVLLFIIKGSSES
jgi:hypothetical protein